MLHRHAPLQGQARVHVDVDSNDESPPNKKQAILLLYLKRISNDERVLYRNWSSLG